jgi:hypothetical protein
VTKLKKYSFGFILIHNNSKHGGTFPWSLVIVTTQDFIKFWGKFFAFVLLEMIGNSQGFKTF